MEEKPDDIHNETQSETPAMGLGTEIAALFRDCGVEPGEEIPELRGYFIQPPDFSE